MKKKFLTVLAITVVSAAVWSLWVYACDRDKQTSAQAVSRGGARTTAVVAASGKGECSAAASAQCAAHGSTSASMGSCEGHGATASVASSGGPSAKGGHDCCAMKSKGATASAGMGACNSKMAGAGMLGAPNCGEHMSSTSNVTSSMHGDCDACADMVACTNELTASGVQTQIVPLRNGVMFVFTTDTPGRVRAVQTAIARRNDRLGALTASGDRARLCPECKSVRGAIASGKMTRETVNIEGGSFTLVTSTDPAMVGQLRELANAQNNGRIKI